MNNYEFHLSYNDVLSFNVDNLDKKFLKKGDAITIENFTPPKRFSDSDKLFCNKKKLSFTASAPTQAD